MATITASEVNDLRQKTGAGLMDCKKALTETNGDVEALSGAESPVYGGDRPGVAGG